MDAYPIATSPFLFLFRPRTAESPVWSSVQSLSLSLSPCAQSLTVAALVARSRSRAQLRNARGPSPTHGHAAHGHSSLGRSSDGLRTDSVCLTYSLAPLPRAAAVAAWSRHAAEAEAALGVAAAALAAARELFSVAVRNIA